MTKKDEIKEIIKDLLEEYKAHWKSLNHYDLYIINILLRIFNNPKKNKEAIDRANITLTTLLNGLIKGDFFLEDFPEATILKLKVLLTGSVNNDKPRKLSEEKIKKIANNVSGGKYNHYQYPIGWLNYLIESGKDIYEEDK